MTDPLTVQAAVQVQICTSTVVPAFTADQFGHSRAAGARGSTLPAAPPLKEQGAGGAEDTTDDRDQHVDHAGSVRPALATVQVEISTPTVAPARRSLDQIYATGTPEATALAAESSGLIAKRKGKPRATMGQSTTVAVPAPSDEELQAAYTEGRNASGLQAFDAGRASGLRAVADLVATRYRAELAVVNSAYVVAADAAYSATERAIAATERADQTAFATRHIADNLVDAGAHGWWVEQSERHGLDSAAVLEIAQALADAVRERGRPWDRRMLSLGSGEAQD